MAQPDGQGEEYKGWQELAKKNYHERGICKKVQEVHLEKKERKKKRRNQGLGGEKRKVVSANGVV